MADDSIQSGGSETGERSTDDTDRCPVCGDRYAAYHKKLRSDDREATLRSDATFCARDLDGLAGKEQWVHIPEQNRSMDSDTDRSGGGE